MEVSNNAGGVIGGAVGTALDAMGLYPFERLDIDVSFNVVAEPNCPGHSEFACTSFGVDGASVEFRNGLGAPTPPPFSEDYAGLKFVQETVAHEVGHVVAGVKINSPDLIAEMCKLFIRTDPMTGERSVGDSSRWAAGEWPDRIGEAVAETFKDVFLAKEMRKFDNRTNWDLPESNFRDYLRLMGMILEGDFQAMSKSSAFYVPSLTEQSNVNDLGEEPGENYHSDVQTFSVSYPDGRPFWCYNGQSAAGLGTPVAFSDKELPQGNLGGVMLFTLGDLKSAEGSVDLELDMSMIPDLAAPYAHQIIDTEPPDSAIYDSSRFEYVGWAPGSWSDFKTYAYWELYWDVTIRPDEGPDYSARASVPAGAYIASMDYREDLIGFPPMFSGQFPLLDPDTLKDLLTEPVYMQIIAITLNLNIEAWQDIGPGHPIRFHGAMPCGPGVVESWANDQQWTADWSNTKVPDKLPLWPYVDEPPEATPGPTGRIRRSRARMGELA